MTNVSTTQLHGEWTEYYWFARWLCRRKLIRIDGTVPPDIDDRVDEAIAHAWRMYPKLRERKPELPAKTAIRWVCKTGVSRVRARTRFVPKPYPGYVDAMDGPAQRCGYFEETIPNRVQEPVPTDPQDRTTVESLIDTLPAHLQAVARLLSYGMSKRMVAERRGISESTLRERIHDIRKALVG